MKLKTGLLLAATAAAAFLAPRAEAFPPPGTPTTANPGPLTGSGLDARAIFAFADAADVSDLFLVGRPGTIFENHANVPGDEVDLGPLMGPQVFGLTNTTTGTTFLANVADSAGIYHVYYTTDFSKFNVGALPAAAADAIAALPTGSSVVFVGWEDLTGSQGSDFDYNDLIFAFSNLTASPVPEPASLALVGAGLFGLGLVRRRKK